LSGARYFSKLQEKPMIFISKQQNSLNFQNKFWDFFNLGQKRFASSLVWIATILESDHDHYKGHDLNSWMFLRFNTISYLDPNFYENYSFGGVYLSIIKDDLSGASIIYDKGLIRYPHDFQLLNDAGFHYYFELGDFSKAYPIYKKLAKFEKSSPIIISSLARLEANDGNLSDALTILEMRYEKLKDKNSVVGNKIWENMYAIRAEIDLTCLNSKNVMKNNCLTKDLSGNKYILKENIFQSSKAWVPFRVKINKKFN
jgi:tetratricopeptide (TPR) repeat protein